MRGPNHGTSLSARECEVAELYVEGLSYKEIARDLDISPATVRTHLNTIYRKLEVTSRIELLHRLDGNGRAPGTSEPAPDPVVERRQLTVMFVDLVGSTALAAGLDAEDMHELLQAYRQAVGRVVEAAGGHAAGFPGDGVVACFGWPRALEDAAERAVRAGLEVLGAIARIQAPDGRELAARVGIATGVVVVDGGKGDADSLTGGTPNLAARLQSVAEPGGLVIAQSTRELVGDLFQIEDLGPQEIKGLPGPVPVFRVMAERSSLSRFEARHSARLAAMVGREVELALLLDRWQRARQGEGQAVLLTGEPGIGKSRLAAALSTAVAADEPVLLRYQTSPQQGDSPLWPVHRQLAGAARLDDATSDELKLQRLGELLQLEISEPGETLALIADFLGLPADPGLAAMSAERRRDRLLDALTGQLVNLAATTPVLMLFEDLHWIDPTSLELLERILARLDALPVMLLLTSRPEGEPRLPAFAHLTRIGLNRLGRAGALAIVERAISERAGGEQRLTPELVESIIERGDGVPLFLEEITAAVLEARSTAAAVPASLQDSLMARLDRLGPAKEVAQLAAVIGREFGHDLLAAAADRPGLDEALHRLIDAELIFRRGRRYVFKHALVQDVAYQSLLRGRRAGLHDRIAETLLGRFPALAAAEPQLVAHHLEHAGRPTAAIDYFVRAADLANYRGSNQEARRYLERALALIEGLPEGGERDRLEVDALTMLGRITVAVDGHASAATKAVYIRALERSRAAGLDRAEFPIVVGLAVNAAVAGDLHEALRLAERARDLAASSDDEVFAVEAYYAIGITRSWRAEWPEAKRHLEAGFARYRPDQHARHLAIYGQDPGVVCACRAAWASWYMGLPETAAGQLETAMALAARLAHPFSTSYGLGWRALIAVESDPAEAALRAIEATAADAEEQNFRTWRVIALACRARWLLEHGDPAEARAASDRALEASRRAGMGNIAVWSLALVADARRLTGDFEAGLARIAEAEALIERGYLRWCEVEVLRIRARLEQAAGLGDGMRTLARAIETARRQHALMPELRATADLARKLAGRGEQERARQRLAACLARFTEGHATRPLVEARELVEQLGS